MTCVHDHLGARTAVLGIADSERMDRLVDQDPQLRVRRRVRVDDDPPRLRIAPTTCLTRDRLERDGESKRLRKRPDRRQPMRVRISEQRFTRRAERSRLTSVDRIDLSALTLSDRIAQPEPSVEARDERGVRSRQRDQ